VSERAFCCCYTLSHREGQVLFSMVLLVAAGSSGICKAFSERNSVQAIGKQELCLCSQH